MPAEALPRSRSQVVSGRTSVSFFLSHSVEDSPHWSLGFSARYFGISRLWRIFKDEVIILRHGCVV